METDPYAPQPFPPDSPWVNNMSMWSIYPERSFLYPLHYPPATALPLGLSLNVTSSERRSMNALSKEALPFVIYLGSFSVSVTGTWNMEQLLFILSFLSVRFSLP